MNYCSLEDAYGAPGSNPMSQSNAVAKKEERKKAKRCRGPPLTFLGLDKDPDRQQLNKLPDAPAMNPATGLREHVPVEESQGYEPFVTYIGTGVGEVLSTKYGIQDISSKLRDDVQQAQDDAAGMNTLPQLSPARAVLTPVKQTSKLFTKFGSDPEDGDSFADYHPDAKNFLMEPSVTAAFYQNPNTGDGAASASTLPIPSVMDVWKPMTPAGADTAYFQSLPRPGGTYPKADGNSHESLSRKIDTIMTRLDEMKRGHIISPDQSQTDVLLFVSSGIFVLFMMDLLVRKGSSLRFLGGF
jgi:hypothetical protein